VCHAGSGDLAWYPNAQQPGTQGISMNRLLTLLLMFSLSSPLVALSANKNCPAQCEAQLEKCVKEARSDKVKETCKTYLKGCLKFCSQAK
jgi:hypothetical protein